MGKLQKALEEVLLHAPYEVLAQKLVEKLASQGVTLTSRERKCLIQHLKSGAIGTLRIRTWKWWDKREVGIELSAEESEEIYQSFTRFLDNKLPEALWHITEDLSSDVLITLQQTWPSESRRQQRDQQAFKKRLHQRWGQGIERLTMFLTIAQEFGEEMNNALRKECEFASPCLADVLLRLHAQACQVTNEILCLISAGFADGAMARWRTLHEIAVVALFLGEHGESVARRYIDHDIVESYKAACDYQKCCSRLGYESMTSNEFDVMHQAYEDVLSKYGASFKAQYGWAAEALDIPQPSFLDIERAAGIEHLRAHYRMASHGIHANPKGIFFKIGLIKETDVLLAGPSNAGLADPGHSAVISLMQVSATLMMLRPEVDSLVSLKILARLQDEIGDAFMDAHQELEEDTS